MKIDDQLTGFWGRVLPKSKATRIAWGASILLSAALVLLPWLVRLDGNPHADWEQFLGRFHPLVVHLPIGLLVLVPVLEVAGRLRPALARSGGICAGAGLCELPARTHARSFCSPMAAATAGPGVTRHMAGGIALTIGVLACLLARPMWPEGSVFYLYPALLACMLPLLVWTAHQGGHSRSRQQLPDSIHAGRPQAVDLAELNGAARLLLCEANQSNL